MHIKHWEDCLSIIKSNINSQSFITWFKPIKPKSYKDKTLTLIVPNKFFYEWLENHYLELLKLQVLFSGDFVVCRLLDWFNLLFLSFLSFQQLVLSQV